MIKTVSKEVGAMAPPVTVTITTILGYTLQEWVYIMTMLYTAIQISRLFPKMYGCAVCFTRDWTCNRKCKF
jgi:hypothetical protein